MTTYFIETSDEGQVMRVERDEYGSYAELVPSSDGPTDFNLVNNLKSSVISEARDEAKRNGLKLRNIKTMGAMV